MTRFVYYGPDANPHPEVKFTHDDLLWLGRAYVGEHGSKDWQHTELFVWTMLNRYILHKGNKHWPTFKYMLRRFSQPVNPRWARGGDLALKRPKFATEKMLRRRERISSLTWNEIPHEVRTVLKRFVGAGTPPWRPVETFGLERSRFSDFASDKLKKMKRITWGRNIGGNVYFENKRLREGVVCVDLWSA